MMRSVRCLLALFVAFASLEVLAQQKPRPAQAQIPEKGWYVGVGAGGASANVDTEAVDAALRTNGAATSSTTGDDGDAAGKVYAGYQINKYFALEGGYASLGKYRFTTVTTGPAATSNTELRASAWFFDIMGILPLSERFALTGSVGIQNTAYKGSFTATNGTNVRVDQTGNGAKFGVGARYNFANNWALRADGEYFGDAEISLFTVGVQYRF